MDIAAVLRQQFFTYFNFSTRHSTIDAEWVIDAVAKVDIGPFPAGTTFNEVTILYHDCNIRMYVTNPRLQSRIFIPEGARLTSQYDLNDLHDKPVVIDIKNYFNLWIDLVPLPPSNRLI